MGREAASEGPSADGRQQRDLTFGFSFRRNDPRWLLTGKLVPMSTGKLVPMSATGCPRPSQNRSPPPAAGYASGKAPSRQADAFFPRGQKAMARPAIATPARTNNSDACLSHVMAGIDIAMAKPRKQIRSDIR
jgi:hypothetical protein